MATGDVEAYCTGLPHLQATWQGHTASCKNSPIEETWCCGKAGLTRSHQNHPPRDTGVSEGEGLQAVALQRGVLALLGFRVQPPVPVLFLREGKDHVSFLCSSLILVEY